MDSMQAKQTGSIFNKVGFNLFIFTCNTFIGKNFASVVSQHNNMGRRKGNTFLTQMESVSYNH